jgi:hypothetical protein
MSSGGMWSDYVYKLYSRPTCLQIFFVLLFNLLVTRCINKFNIQQQYALTTLHLCIV